MQDRYAGDVGDFVKLGLLRALAPGHRLGLAWYRYPDEAHNKDGRHLSYLDDPDALAALDPELFLHLRDVVLKNRSIHSLLPMLDGAISSDESICTRALKAKERAGHRSAWFARVLNRLAGCDIVFADPDNGIVGDEPARPRTYAFGKSIPLSEIRALADGRCAVIYHHNTRRPGGHDAEVDHWIERIGCSAVVVRATAYSPRTFFVLNPTPVIESRVQAFCHRWRSMKVRLHAVG